ncbi:splicing factor ESS-2 homolog [Phlebotomus papatasi]|uniref:splicing factor ESS-2 homolog n=1 Tax=Phlebotomus papatasi TaxID=29031 RepID=UPI002484482A|nr:splicing factor ESS-2 homolog [Phlebotomus papatasi]
MGEKPGEKALIAMKSMSKSVASFKVPKVPKEKIVKAKILTEDKYVEELGKIIQRDFFPDLEKLKAQNQYLDAVEKNDMVKLRELYEKYSGRRPNQTGSESPATFETPVNRPDATPVTSSRKSTVSMSESVQESREEDQKISEKHSLDTFLDTYTSEDNQSFQEIIEKADQKLRQKFEVLYKQEKVQALEMAKRLALPPIEEQFEANEGVKKVDMWTYRNKNFIMYVPDGVELSKEEQIEIAQKKQEIVHGNTRLIENPFNEQQSRETISQMAKNQQHVLEGKVDVDGNVLNTEATPQIRGFSFVRTPSPCPGVSESPLMTWGEIEGTPFRLDGGDTPLHLTSTPAFRIAETPRREAIALELAERAGERLRGQKARAMEAARRNIASPYARSALERLATMSPAAKRLASSRFGLTPSPTRKNPTTPRIARQKATPSPLIRKKTPRISATVAQTAKSPEKQILTDDLLNIPTQVKRNKAADFF